MNVNSSIVKVPLVKVKWLLLWAWRAVKIWRCGSCWGAVKGWESAAQRVLTEQGTSVGTGWAESHHGSVCWHCPSYVVHTDTPSPLPCCLQATKVSVTPGGKLCTQLQTLTTYKHPYQLHIHTHTITMYIHTNTHTYHTITMYTLTHIYTHTHTHTHTLLSLIHIWRCRRVSQCRSRWSPYH